MMFSISLKLGRFDLWLNLGGFRGWKCTAHKGFLEEYVELKGFHSRFRAQVNHKF